MAALREQLVEIREALEEVVEMLVLRVALVVQVLQDKVMLVVVEVEQHLAMAVAVAAELEL